MLRKIALQLFLLAVTVSAGMGQEVKLRITAPEDGAPVSERPFVEGMVANPDAEVWVVVHPMEVSTTRSTL